MVPPNPQIIYNDFEIGNEFPRLIKILENIKIEHKIDSFIVLADYLETLYVQITAQKYIARKTLTYMDGISNLFKAS